MMKRLLPLFMLLMLPAAAMAQWEYAGVFPVADTFTVDMHGVAVDPDGKVWLTPFGSTEALLDQTSGDTLRNEDGSAIVTRAIYVYNADGTEVDFSPIQYLTVDGVQDTLFNSNRGLGTNADGNILAAVFDKLYVIDYQTGEALAAVIPQPDNSLSAPRADENGNIFTALVVEGAGPLRIFDADLNFVENAIDTTQGFSRSFAVTADGNAIYWGGYTNRALWKYTRPDEFSPFDTVPDTLVRGVVAESMVRNPATGNIWFSNSLAAGGFAPEGRFADSTTFRRWYALDPATDEIVDSLQWQDPAGSNPATVDEKPRGIAFSPDGNTAYAVVFDALSGEPSVQKFIRGATAIERDENVIPERFALEGNYPNPFNPSTSIRFSLDEPGLTRLAVYDVLGREVAVLVNEQLAAGSYTATFDASGLSSGTYLYRLDFQGQQQTGTMTFFK